MSEPYISSTEYLLIYLFLRSGDCLPHFNLYSTNISLKHLNSSF